MTKKKKSGLITNKHLNFIDAVKLGLELYPEPCYGIFMSDKEEACIVGGAMAVCNLSFPPQDWLMTIQKFQDEYGVSLYSANDGSDPDDICNEPIPKDMLLGMLIVIA